MRRLHLPGALTRPDAVAARRRRDRYGGAREAHAPPERPIVAAYFQVISIPKKCTNTCRLGRFFAFCCGLRM